MVNWRADLLMCANPCISIPRRILGYFTLSDVSVAYRPIFVLVDYAMDILFIKKKGVKAPGRLI